MNGPDAHLLPAVIPLTLVTGLLGAGKTTLLNRLLSGPEAAGTLIVVNERGAVALDQHLLSLTGEDLPLLESGCLCCSQRSSLTRFLEDLLRRKDNRRGPDFSRVVLETTGLADPLPVLASVLSHPYLSRRYQLSGVVTVVDACQNTASLDGHPEARKQVLLADVLVVTKSDLCQPERPTDDLRHWFSSMNPQAAVIDGQVLPANALERILFGGFAPQCRSQEARRALWRARLRG